MIADLIREARTEQEIFHLLNAYIEAAGCDGKSSYLPDDMATLPSCVNDVMQRCFKLMEALDVSSKRLDDEACLALKEALHVYGNALNRLKSLEREKHRSLGGYVPVHGISNVARGVPGVVGRLDVH